MLANVPALMIRPGQKIICIAYLTYIDISLTLVYFIYIGIFHLHWYTSLFTKTSLTRYFIDAPLASNGSLTYVTYMQDHGRYWIQAPPTGAPERGACIQIGRGANSNLGRNETHFKKYG